MPSGDSPRDAQAYYDYLQSHHITDGRVTTWQVDWTAIGWLWGFAIAMTVLLVFWVQQYRTSRKRAAIYPMDRFHGWTAEAAGPPTAFFLLLTLGLVAIDAVIIVGHIVWGQTF
jgi:hypothetical protein